MKAIDKIKAIGEKFQGDSLYYLIGVDEDGDQVCEINSYDSYCSGCIDKIVKEMNEELRLIGHKKFCDRHDCTDDYEFTSVSYSEGSCPESDDFVSCENCGCEIQASVLFTFSQEIDFWVDENINIDILSDQDSYRIWTCITSEDAKERHPESVKKLTEKLNSL